MVDLNDGSGEAEWSLLDGDSEVRYRNYSRVHWPRTKRYFHVDKEGVGPRQPVRFPMVGLRCGGDAEHATHLALSVDGRTVASWRLSQPIYCSIGVTPCIELSRPPSRDNR